MNFRDLQYLVAVDEERHFNKAAQRCFVSQPTLSGQLKKLEEELGVLLVERTSRQVVMTDVGKAIAEQARKIQFDVDGIRDIAQTFDDPMAGELHVGLIPTVAPYLLPIIMPQLSRQYPKLKLWLYEYHTATLLDKMRHGELDLLILALPLPNAPRPGEFSEVRLFREPFQLAVSRHESLASQRMISLQELENRDMLLLEEGHCLRGQALDICMSAGARENSGFHASSLETLRHMVGEGMGMTLIPQLAVPRKQAAYDAIRYLQFQDPKPNRTVGLLYRKGSYREQTFTTMGKMICDVLPNTLIKY
jgi:LysR family hydrogen peroxide-inducible transcriptional activator